VAEPSTPAPSGGGKGLKLGKQVGPLPVGVWIAVVGGGLAVAYFINRSRGSAPADASSTGDFGSATSGTGTGASSVWSANTAPGSPTTPMISTNVQWAQAAGNYLLTTGADPVLVDTALRKYLFNQPLNQQETAVIRAAIAQFGLPPEPLPPATGDGSLRHLPKVAEAIRHRRVAVPPPLPLLPSVTVKSGWTGLIRDPT
jgi:hypothetical protein